MPLVSVVIPAFNAELFLSDAIESVLAQGCGDWGLVVVDDGSTDQTPVIAAEFCQSDPRIRLVSQANGGLSAARNTGAAATDSNYLLFLDADDVLLPTALDDLLDLISASPDAVGAYGLPERMASDGTVSRCAINDAWGYSRIRIDGWRPGPMAVDAPTDLAALVVWLCIETAGQVLIRRAALDSAGPWTTMPGEDWEMWLRLARCGEFAFLPRFTLRKRSSPGSLSSNGKWLAGAEPIIRRMLARPPFTKRQRRTARWGYFWSVGLRYKWALLDLRRGRIGPASRGVLSATRSAVRFALLAPTY